MREYVNKKETSEGTFYYVDYGKEYHGRTTYRMWVHHSLVEHQQDKDKSFITIPKIGIELSHGKRPRTLILRPGGNLNLFHIHVPCGYRGEAEFQINEHVEEIYKYAIYKSPTGSLGISAGALVITKQDVLTYTWKRTGRLYGAPEQGTTTLFLDGRVEELEETDLDEIRDLAE